MKKFLSLVMALALTVSLFTISAGAKDFTDKSSINYKEAVDVISALGVVGGYNDGSFAPTGTLTRGAAAKIICNLVLGPTTGSSLGVNSAPFKDVSTSNVFAGYIAYCSQQKIINGYADGTFKPAATVTGFQFMKMLLGALGYDGSVEGFTGPNWTVAVAKLAVSIGLDDGNDSFLGSKAMTREEAALYAYNTLNATMVEYDTTGTTIVVGGTTITQGASKASEVKNSATASTQTIKHDAYMQFGEKYFKDLKKTADTDAFERSANTWTYKTTSIGTYAKAADATYTAKVKLGTIYSDLGLSKNVAAANVTYYVDGIKQTSTPYNLGITKGETTKIGGAGALTDVYYDSDAGTAVVSVINTYVGKISATYAKSSTRDAYVTIDPKTGSGSSYDTDGSFATGDYVLYTFSSKSGDSGVQSMVKAESVTGTLTAYSTDSSFTVGGTKYDANAVVGYSDGNNLNNAVKTDVTVYLDSYGYAAYVDASAASSNYAVVLGYSGNTGIGIGNNQAKLLFTDGTVKTVNLTSDTAFAGSDDPVATPFTASTTKNSTLINQYDIVSYSVNSDNNYKLTPKADTTGVTTANPIVKGTSTLALPANAYNSTPTSRDKATYANGKTIFLVADGDTYSVYTGIANVPTVTLSGTGTYITAYVKDAAVSGTDTFKSGAATVVFVLKNANAVVTSTSKDVTFILGSSTTGASYNSDLNTYYAYDAIVNGEITTINTSNPIDKYTMAKDLSYNSKKVATVDLTNKAVNSDHASVGTFPAGIMYYDETHGTQAAANGVVGLNGTYYSYDKDCKVFFISTDGKISESAVGSIGKDSNDKVWFNVNNGDVTTIVIKTVDDSTSTTPVNTGYTPVVTIGTGTITVKAYNYTYDSFTSAAISYLQTNGYTVKSVSASAIVATKNSVDYSFTPTYTSVYKLTAADGTVSYLEASAPISGLSATTYAKVTYNSGVHYVQDGATMPAYDTVINATGFYKVTGVADVTTAAVIDSTVGHYTYATAKTSGTGEKVGNDFYVQTGAKLTVTVTWVDTTITTTSDGVTVAVTGGSSPATTTKTFDATSVATTPAQSVELTITAAGAISISGSHT